MGREEEKESHKSRLAHFRGMFREGGRETKSVIVENDGSLSPVEDDKVTSRSHGSLPSLDQEEEPDNMKIGGGLNRMENDKSPKTPPPRMKPTDMDLMKEKFAKLLLGEDMSGGGKGVFSALALSNAVTNLAASAFGEQRKLEPMAADTKARWKKEIDWLLSVTDHIVEFVPSKQKGKDGSNMEIMTTRQRTDLHMNIPALRKLDAMLLDCLDNFKDNNEFYYTSSKADDDESKKGRADNKWWIPTPKVPPNGLSEASKRWIQFQKDSVTQVLKAAMAINAQVLSEMEIPETYIDALPKNGRASLGDSMYKSITDEYFDPDYFLSTVDLSSEHKILDLKNKLEASVVIWERKMLAKDHNKSSWGSAVSLEKREIFEDRANTILLILKHRFPGLPQSDLDITKIQLNRDVGQAILESYSRVIESLAFTVLSRIEEVMQADSLASSNAEPTRSPLKEQSPIMGPEDNSAETPTSMTLLDFMGWNLDNGEAQTKKDFQDEVKPANKKTSYIEKLENLGGLRSPTSRH